MKTIRIKMEASETSKSLTVDLKKPIPEKYL